MFRKNNYSSFAVDGPFNGLLFHVLLVVWDDILRNTLRCFDHGAIEEAALTAFNIALDQFHAAVADRKAVLFSLPQNLQRTGAAFRAAGNA